ncbi:hypothetical protein ACFWFR_00785 [Oerskovia sp. NPDC060287]|uniref:hypothetical protein n=1 Tax=Oerskovia sp. NPDC060287 TaxID=3347095 RepID=UPI0036493DF3
MSDFLGPSESLVAFVPRVSLLSIGYSELSATASDLPAEAPESDAFDVDPEYTLNVAIHPSEPRFGLRLRVDIEGPFGVLHVETQADYEADGIEQSALSNALLVEYANHVGLFAMVPYARQAIADLSLRVFGSPLLMPTMQRGDLTFPSDALETRPTR